MNRQSTTKKRVEERHLPKNISLETLLKPRQVALHPDQKAKEYVERMYSFDVISDYAQKILDELKNIAPKKSYIRQKFVYQLGFVEGTYKGSVDYPTSLPSTSDFYSKDEGEKQILNEVIQLLQPARVLKQQVTSIPIAPKTDVEVDDIFEDVGTDYVITTNRNRTQPISKAHSLSLSEDSDEDIEIPVDLEAIKSRIDTAPERSMENSDSESDLDLPLMGDMPEQFDSYDYVDSGSEEDDVLEKKAKTSNLDHELKKVSGVYHQKYGQGLVEEKTAPKKRSNPSEATSIRKKQK
jgi:hypothetical protein